MHAPQFSGSSSLAYHPQLNPHDSRVHAKISKAAHLETGLRSMGGDQFASDSDASDPFGKPFPVEKGDLPKAVHVIPERLPEIAADSAIQSLAKGIFKLFLALVFHSANPGFFLMSFVVGMVFSEEVMKRIDLITAIVKNHLFAIMPAATFATLFYTGILTPPPQTLLLGSILFPAYLGAEAAKRYYAWRDQQDVQAK